MKIVLTRRPYSCKARVSRFLRGDDSPFRNDRGRRGAGPSRTWHAALRRQAEMIHRGSQQSLPEEGDRHEADDRFRDVLRMLESEGDPGSS